MFLNHFVFLESVTMKFAAANSDQSMILKQRRRYKKLGDISRMNAPYIELVRVVNYKHLVNDVSNSIYVYIFFIHIFSVKYYYYYSDRNF